MQGLLLDLASVLEVDAMLAARSTAAAAAGTAARPGAVGEQDGWEQPRRSFTQAELSRLAAVALRLLSFATANGWQRTFAAVSRVAALGCRDGQAFDTALQQEHVRH